jgi:hypothetical protein
VRAASFVQVVFDANRQRFMIVNDCTICRGRDRRFRYIDWRAMSHDKKALLGGLVAIARLP